LKSRFFAALRMTDFRFGVVGVVVRRWRLKSRFLASLGMAAFRFVVVGAARRVGAAGVVPVCVVGWCGRSRVRI
jgi:hypothetical protein